MYDRVGFFSRNYTVPGHPRSPSRYPGLGATNLFSLSLEISDDVHCTHAPSPQHPLSSRPESFRTRRVEGDLSKSARTSLAHLSRYIFKIAYKRPRVHEDRTPRRKFVVAPKTESERPRGPLKIRRGEHLPRPVRRLSRVFEESFISGE